MTQETRGGSKESPRGFSGTISGTPRKPRVVSLFCGCGGSSLGYRMAGCRVILAVDWEQKAVDTYRLNFPDTACLKADIRTIDETNVFGMTKLKPRELDILDGSPPCTPFSMCGRREKSWNKSYVHSGDSSRQTTDDLFFEYIRMIKILEPKVFVSENVKGLIMGKAKGYFINILKAMNDSTAGGYRIKAVLVNAKDFEVPQSRERVLIYGIRNDVCLDERARLKTHPEISFEKATRDLIVPKEELDYSIEAFDRSGFRKYFLQMRQGESVDDYHPLGNGYNWIRLKLNRPSPTITTFALHNLIHPVENRFLTLSEYRRLSTFPDDFRFLDRTDGAVRIGNSVPPRLIYHVARHLLEKTNNLQLRQTKLN